MTPIAVVSGAAAGVAEVIHELELVGVRAIPARESDRLQSESVDAYVQLPVEAAPRTNSLIGLRGLLQAGLIRVDALSAVLPSLRPDGHVVLVAGDALVDPRLPDATRSPFEVLRTMAAVLKQEYKVTAVVVDPCTSPQEIARVVWNGNPLHRVQGSLADLSPDLSYTDWLREALSYSIDPSRQPW